jgi:glutamate-1-semialdehyde aminotransferase
MKNQPKALVNKLRLAMLINGVDLNPRGGGLLSCTHTDDDVANTTAAFREAIRMLKQEGELAG